MGCLTQQKPACSQSWNPAFWNQGVSRTACFVEAWEEPSPMPAFEPPMLAGTPQRSLACGCLTPFQWLPNCSPCLCHPLQLTTTGLRTRLLLRQRTILPRSRSFLPPPLPLPLSVPKAFRLSSVWWTTPYAVQSHQDGNLCTSWHCHQFLSWRCFRGASALIDWPPNTCLPVFWFVCLFVLLKP